MAVNLAIKGRTGYAPIRRRSFTVCHSTEASLTEGCSPEFRTVSGDDGWLCADNDGLSGVDKRAAVVQWCERTAGPKICHPIRNLLVAPML